MDSVSRTPDIGNFFDKGGKNKTKTNKNKNKN